MKSLLTGIALFILGLIMLFTGSVDPSALVLLGVFFCCAGAGLLFTGLYSAEKSN